MGKCTCLIVFDRFSPEMGVPGARVSTALLDPRPPPPLVADAALPSPSVSAFSFHSHPAAPPPTMMCATLASLFEVDGCEMKSSQNK